MIAIIVNQLKLCILQNQLNRTQIDGRDWSELDELVRGCAKTVHYTPSMFAQIQEKVQMVTRQQRQVRKRGELGIEKKPTVLTQNSQPEKGAGKLNLVVRQILKVSFT